MRPRVSRRGRNSRPAWPPVRALGFASGSATGLTDRRGRRLRFPRRITPDGRMT